MIPRTIEIVRDGNNEYYSLPSFTYRLDTGTGRIIGTVDTKEAMLQAIDKLLQTMRYSAEVYDWLYGHDLFDLLGKPYAYVVAECPRMVEECLLQDDRIIKVHSFHFERINIDAIKVDFAVDTIYGTVQYTKEVKV